jgi:Flp pilus assembly pilin Flp
VKNLLKLFAWLQTSATSLRREEGQTMAEYGVVLTVITLAIVTAFAVFGTGIERSILRAVALIPK